MFGKVLGKFWGCVWRFVGYVLGCVWAVNWKCFGHVFNMFLDMCWLCFGTFLDSFWEGPKVKESKKRIRVRRRVFEMLDFLRAAHGHAMAQPRPGRGPD